MYPRTSSALLDFLLLMSILFSFPPVVDTMLSDVLQSSPIWLRDRVLERSLQGSAPLPVFPCSVLTCRKQGKKTSPVVIFVDGAKLLPLQEDPCCEGRGQLLESGLDHTEV